METERTITVVGQTPAGALAMLKSRAYKEHEPTILVGPFRNHAGGGFVCKIKRMMTDHDGKRLPDDENTGTLRVFDDADGTRLTFIVGGFYDPDLFWRAAGDIVAELERRDFRVRGWADAPAPPTRDSAHKIHVPQRAKEYRRWKDAYAIIRETRKEYQRQYDNGSTDNPQPKINDYIDAIASKMAWKPSGKTVERILKAGDAKGLKR